MSNKYDMTEKRWGDMTRIIKVISDGVKGFYDKAKAETSPPDRDISLVAMQVLAILCGLSRGYTREQIDALWKTSIETATNIHASRQGDRAEKGLQVPIGYEHRKN